MTINGYNFIYANQTSEEFGVILCNFGSVNTDSNDEETSIITTTTPFKETFDFLYLEKSAPLSFKITICKENGDFMDSSDERTLKKWLCKNSRYWLQIDQDDLADIYYRCIITNPRKDDVAKRTGGLTFDVTCDCGHAWSGLNKKTYATVGGTLTFTFNNTLDYDEYILYPILTITPTVAGTITIKNNTTNITSTITNCVTTEILTMDGKNDNLKSSNGRVMLDSWNKNVLELQEGINNITITGNCTMKMEYRLPVRVGG